jgi:hypothetical protein
VRKIGDGFGVEEFKRGFQKANRKLIQGINQLKVKSRILRYLAWAFPDVIKQTQKEHKQQNLTPPCLIFQRFLIGIFPG